MAVTSLWHIKGDLKDLVNYVENPDKTVPETEELRGLYQLLDYVQRPDAVPAGAFVTAINCNADHAVDEMIATKLRFDKTDGYIAWHGYQSFKPGEISAADCHALGVAFAKEMWGDRFQIIVTTHLDRDHLHNHFCFNSVSFKDGKKYDYRKSERVRMMEISDRLCKERGLSVIENPGKAPPRAIWERKKKGEKTRYDYYREDIIQAVEMSRTVDAFERYLTRKGYEVDLTGEHWTIKSPQPVLTFSPHLPPEQRSKGFLERLLEGTSIYKLYLYHCYQLGILPNHSEYTPTSPYLKEALQWCDQVSKQVRYMADHGIETMEDLMAARNTAQSEFDQLVADRDKLRNKIRRASPEDKAILRSQKAILTAKITNLREQLKLNYGIEARSVEIKDTWDKFIANEERGIAQETQAKLEQKQKKQTKVR
ncbi:MAG: relaxase/mobilization nuclease domain-containing protein [Lachnospiraceae bacterium]|nr:relaxase/mobilization nuclease domain-containing protein [Lachnospiraceae bacterium]